MLAVNHRSGHGDSQPRRQVVTQFGDVLLAPLQVFDRQPTGLAEGHHRRDRFGSRPPTVLVTGSSGDYLAVADTIIEMNAYQPRDVTERARKIAAARRMNRFVRMLMRF